ncbi:hypothetical protein [Streptomyces gobiensis]|uniref:hypothetical protein n=1 Tax=Streptomyces gobiensis TaxID=2875706 RepID=UPI001E565C38|nr:hypothetical protein [Streptomyces gobiensis]UGY93267.1 hypothetical protein test1122_17125 [Streptomyces gobiensis]
MADDRYSWLDEEAAERLLRGQPVDAAAAEYAGRLAEALENIAVTCPSKSELPGEAAALVAFRDARSQIVHSGGLEPRSGRGLRALRLSGRPLRAGLAVALVGCTIGGVAVAATTGALPSPFGGGGGAKPASSTALPDGPRNGTPQSAPHGPSASAGQHGGHTHPDGDPDSDKKSAGSGQSADGDNRDAAGADRDEDGKQPGAAGKNGKPLVSGKPDKAVLAALCKAYANGKIDESERRRLEEAAGGSTKVHGFCQQHGGGSGNSRSSGSSGNTGDSGGSKGENKGEKKRENKGGGERGDARGGESGGDRQARSDRAHGNGGRPGGGDAGRPAAGGQGARHGGGQGRTYRGDASAGQRGGPKSAAKSADKGGPRRASASDPASAPGASPEPTTPAPGSEKTPRSKV